MSGGWYASLDLVAKYWLEGCVYPVTATFCRFQSDVATVPTGAVLLTKYLLGAGEYPVTVARYWWKSVMGAS